MERNYIATGKTIDQAIRAALEALSMDRDSVSVEVLENAKSGFLGIGASPAKVKVTYEVPDEINKPTAALSSASRSKPRKEAKPVPAAKVVDLPKAAPKQPTPAPKPQAGERSEQPREPRNDRRPSRPKPERPQQDKPRQDKPQQDKPRQDKPQQDKPRQDRPQQDKPQQDKPRQEKPRQDRPRQDRPQHDKPRQESRPQPEKHKAEMAAPKEYTPAQPGSVEERIEQFIAGLLQHMGSEAVPHASRTADDTFYVELVGENLGMLIGRRGDTLDAIQHLTNYTINRDATKRFRINVDAEAYRAKREESLQRLAKKVADKVIRYRRNITLEPMNAYERHVIHATLQDVDEVSTFSTGTEPNRRVVVSFNRYKNTEASK